MIVITLNCDHTALWTEARIAPRNGEHIYCFRCNDMARVTSHAGDLRVICENGDFDRVYQQDGRAASAVRKHLDEYRDHSMVMSRIGWDETYRIRQSQDRML